MLYRFLLQIVLRVGLAPPIFTPNVTRHSRPGSVERGRSGDIQTLPVRISPVKIGGEFRGVNDAEAGPIGIENVKATEARAVYVGPGIDFHAVWGADAFADRRYPYAALRQRAVRVHFEHADVSAFRVVHEKTPLIWGEAQAVRLQEVVSQQCQPSCLWVHEVDPTEFEFAWPGAFIVLHPAVGRIREAALPRFLRRLFRSID
jgi:hypothetical protein